MFGMILYDAVALLERTVVLTFTVGCSFLDEDASNVQIMCAWCQKVGVKRYSLSMGSELKSFCSEKCFAACRRAYFKRNKVTFLISSSTL